MTWLRCELTLRALHITLIWTWPETLEMSTPAGARRAMLEVELSRVREWPAGDLTAFVARESLGQSDFSKDRERGAYFTLRPADPVSRTLSDPITVSPGLLENNTLSVGSVSSNIPARTFKPESSKHNKEIESRLWTVNCETYQVRGWCAGSYFCCLCLQKSFHQRKFSVDCQPLMIFWTINNWVTTPITNKIQLLHKYFICSFQMIHFTIYMFESYRYRLNVNDFLIKRDFFVQFYFPQIFMYKDSRKYLWQHYKAAPACIQGVEEMCLSWYLKASIHQANNTDTFLCVMWYNNTMIQ